MNRKTVQDVMTQDVVSVSKNDTVLDAANIMKNLNVGAVPVVESGKPVGMITDRDIVLRNIATSGDVKEPVSKVMSPQVVTVTPSTDVHEAARLMAQHQVRRLPVVDNGNVVGIISLGDFATEQIFVNEAGEALSNISTPSMPATYGGAVDSNYSHLSHDHQGNTEV